MSQFFNSGMGAGAATVTSFSFTDANGFDGTVTNPTTTPNLTLQTNVGTNQVIYASGGALTGTGTGSAGQVLQSAGAGSPPAYSTATYPSTAGTSGNVLTSNGTNFVSSAPASFTRIVVQTFIANGTYTPTSGMKYCIAECVGGGGGGGGAVGDVANAAAGSGGGGGAYFRGVFSAVQIGASQAVTIGQGGTAGSAAGSAPTNGGNTSLGALIVAGGGSGGASASTPGANGATNGGNGAGTGYTAGFYPSSGGSGGDGYWNVATNLCISGAGGSAGLGGGFNNMNITANTGSTIAGIAGNFPGGGGSGATQVLNATGAAGGTGAQGIIVITEYI